MTAFTLPLYPALVSAAALWLALLWAGARLTAGRSRWMVNVGFGFVAVLILFLPVDGAPLWNWAFSLCPNPSLPFAGLVGAALWQRLVGRPLFRPADWRAAWIFGAIAGSILYLQPLCFGAIDFYNWGWDRTGSVWCLAALAIVGLAAGNRMGLLLLAALIAYAVDALESKNCWDYVIDPFYWLIGLALVARRSLGWCLSRRRRIFAARADGSTPPVADPVFQKETPARVSVS